MIQLVRRRGGERNINKELNKNMSTKNDNNGYMLIFRGTDWYKGLSPEQMQHVFDQWMGWFNRLKDEGTAVAGNPLEPKGKIVSGKNGTVSDGPFAEAKETIGGYFLLKVAGKDEALVIARQCPGLPYGISFVVRIVRGKIP